MAARVTTRQAVTTRLQGGGKALPEFDAAPQLLKHSLEGFPSIPQGEGGGRLTRACSP
ncbi:MAG TPA: hypothetical protein VI653_27550 [Steroidobacteraceae bacterium]